MIPFLINLIVLMLVFGLIYYLILMLNLPPPFAMIARVVGIVILILVLLDWVYPYMRLPFYR